jgi:hypothetical protein
MSINPTDVYARVRSLISSAGTPDTGTNLLFPTSSLEHALEAAVLWHSQFKPRTILWLGTPDGDTAIFDLPEDLVSVKRVESPYGDVPPIFIPATDWVLHQGTVGYELIFDTAPGSGDVFGIFYNGVWGTPNLGSPSLMPMAYLSCAFLSMREAARFAGNITPLLDADTIDYRSQSGAWVRLSNEFMSLYARSYGLSMKQVQQGAPPLAFGIGPAPSHARYERFWWVTE